MREGFSRRIGVAWKKNLSGGTDDTQHQEMFHEHPYSGYILCNVLIIKIRLKKTVTEIV